MNDWTAGYVADLGYTFGYYAELNPLRVPIALLNQGWEPPRFEQACELGFGQGLSVAIHAAASETRWHGTDFNPGQTGFARSLAAAAGADARLQDDAFAEFAQRTDLPEFDFIGLHGIWSWISEANRAVIVDFVRRRLKVGGVLYISYNTLPGWSAFAPVRHLMTEHARVLGAAGQGRVSQIDGALDFVERLLGTQPALLRAHPGLAERLQTMKGLNRHYLAHEYFNRDWHPMHFATLAAALDSAKLQYAGSAHYLDQLDVLNLTAGQQALLSDVPDAGLRETVRDAMVNQQFRRDYWVKGARRLAPLEQLERIRQQTVMLASHRPEVPLTVKGALGEATLTESVYRPLLDLLADHRPRSLGQIEADLRAAHLTLSQLLQATMVLAAAGHVVPVQDAQTAAKVRPRTDALNAHLCDRARFSTDIAYLASPVTGGAIMLPRISQLFLLAHRQGASRPADWAQSAWQSLAAQGQTLVKDGRALETAEDNLAELTTQAQALADQHWSRLQALQVV